MQKTALAEMEKRTVAIIHPAWHSCGSHTVFCGQAAAYRAMGAHVVAIAVGTTLRQNSRNKGFWDHYYKSSGDLIADLRAHTGPSKYALIVDSARRKLALELSGADYARQMAGLTDLSPVPPAIAGLAKIDLIHCNHYFNMPLALRLKERFGAPILLETHDVQSRQYALRGAVSLVARRKATFEEMVESELKYVGKADMTAHINAEEHDFFKERLPGTRHVLLYPPINSNRRALSDHRFLMIASANYPNYLSVLWLLERVLPLCNPINLNIIGNIDHEVRVRSPATYARFKAAFLGRVDGLQWHYDNATAVLLPTAAGHGLSIKTIEALESGAPLIGTSLAFRGMNVDLASIRNLRIADTPEQFAAAIDEADREMLNATRSRNLTTIELAGEHSPDEVKRAREWLREYDRQSARQAADTRRVAEDLFSFKGYVGTLRGLAGELLSSR